MDTLKAMTRRRSPKIGTFVAEFATPGIGHILKSAGCDFAFFDCEHSGFDIGTVKSAVRYFEAAGLPMLVRVPSIEYHHIARALDVGAEGIMVPMVGSVEDAQRIVRSARYFPRGQRGSGMELAHDRYRPGNAVEKMAAGNERTTVFCLIETVDGVESADAIAALDEVDCLWIGHNDLSLSLGLPGQFNHPKFVGAVDRVVAAAKRHNKSIGRLVPDVATGIAVGGAGFDFICYSGDVWVLRNAMTEGIAKVRAGLAGATR